MAALRRSVFIPETSLFVPAVRSLLIEGLENAEPPHKLPLCTLTRRSPLDAMPWLTSIFLILAMGVATAASALGGAETEYPADHVGTCDWVGGSF
jgi:hypothetical protein